MYEIKLHNLENSKRHLLELLGTENDEETRKSLEDALSCINEFLVVKTMLKFHGVPRLDFGFSLDEGKVYSVSLPISARYLCKGERLNDAKEVTGYYWCVDEHHNPELSKKHFIKSINNGIDYEVDFKTIEYVAEE